MYYAEKKVYVKVIKHDSKDYFQCMILNSKQDTEAESEKVNINRNKLSG